MSLFKVKYINKKEIYKQTLVFDEKPSNDVTTLFTGSHIDYNNSAGIFKKLIIKNNDIKSSINNVLDFIDENIEIDADVQEGMVRLRDKMKFLNIEISVNSEEKPLYIPREKPVLHFLEENYILKYFGGSFDEIDQKSLRDYDKKCFNALKGYVKRKNRKIREQNRTDFVKVSDYVPTVYSKAIADEEMQKKTLKTLKTLKTPKSPLLKREELFSPKEYLRNLPINYPHDKLPGETAILYLARMYPIDIIDKYGDIKMKDIYGAGYKELYSILKSYFYNKEIKFKGRTIKDIIPEAWGL